MRNPEDLLHTICAIRLVHAQIRIRKQREGEMIALAELLQFFDRILGYA